jgi:polyhydroxybutyrate depolymerase
MITEKYFCFILLLFVLGSCKKENDPGSGGTKPNFTLGKNRFTINIDGDEREYFVHVPRSYHGTVSVPVAFMLHGTSGDGEKFYNISGWKELGEVENIITVFPSSWKYCIKDIDGIKTTTKWNVPPDAEWTYCAGQVPRDDIKFLKAIISELDVKYTIDLHRIYLSGFSNGGQMAAKCAIEMGDVFAAIAENAGSFYKDSTYVPRRKLPVIFQVGNIDYGPGNTGPAVALSKLESILSTAGKGIVYNDIAQRHIKYFTLDPKYTMSGDTTNIRVANYKPATGSGYEFRFMFVSGLDHIYPNGVNHPVYSAKLHWDWMKQYTKP